MRYPRGEGFGLELPKHGEVLPIGRGRIVREGAHAAILCLGTRLYEAKAAADMLAAEGIEVTLADARFMKPLDTKMIEDLARNHPILITVEDGSMGGFGAAVMHHLAWAGLLDGHLRFRPMTLPDRFLEHDSPAKQWIDAGLTAKDIAATVKLARG